VEWQRLMKQWELARMEYAAACRGMPDGPDHGATGSADASLEQARRNLKELKQQIDSLISTCARARAASTGPLRLAFLETPTKSPVTTKSPKVSTFDQAFPRYSKR